MSPAGFTVPVRLFELGRVVATRGVVDTCPPEVMQACLGRHIRGDWGVIDKADWKANFEALRDGSRLLSAYAIDPAIPSAGHGGNTLWIITEADRSVTTLLLPAEY